MHQAGGAADLADIGFWDLGQDTRFIDLHAVVQHVGMMDGSVQDCLLVMTRSRSEPKA